MDVEPYERFMPTAISIDIPCSNHLSGKTYERPAQRAAVPGDLWDSEIDEGKYVLLARLTVKLVSETVERKQQITLT